MIDAKDKEVTVTVDDVEQQEVAMDVTTTDTDEDDVKPEKAATAAKEQHLTYNDEEIKKEYEEKLIDAPMREIKFSGGIFSAHALAFNPVTSLLGLLLLWSAAIW